VAGNVLGSDCGSDIDGVIDYMWVGFNSNTNWQEFLNLYAKNVGCWICGQVVVLPSQPLGFYFNPDTTAAAEVTIETDETSIDLIKRNPAYYAGGQWCVGIKIEQTLASSP
jgi:hypothetical protein